MRAICPFVYGLATVSPIWKPCLIKFPPDLLAEMDADAAALGLSRSEWIRRASRGFLDPTTVARSRNGQHPAVEPEAKIIPLRTCRHEETVRVGTATLCRSCGLRIR